MYAVIATGGKQYKVQPNDVFEIERIAGEAGSKVVFSEVLAVADEGQLHLGNPHVEGASVDAEIVGHLRGKKLIAFKMKRRKGYRKKIGHRQELTKVKILAINAPVKKTA